MNMIGLIISHYKIISKLGEGGMGEVFLAEDTKLDRKVALKFLPAHMSVQDDVKARFIQEAKAASALNHPNVCTIYDILEADGRIFIAMEYVDGQTLRDKRGTLSEKQTLEIAAQIADGLAAAHEKGIVHRDIKSENIMLRKDGIPQIMDFGLAKLRGVSRLTKEGSTLGTVGYMSPEQALGHDVDHRSDLFSLGVVIYELLTGELPFKGGHEAAIMYEIVNVDAAPPSAVKPDIDTELDRIVLECLQKEPSERYQGAREIAKDLRRFKRDSGRKTASRIAPAGSVTKSRVQPASVRTNPSRLPWIVAGLFAAGMIVLALLLARKPRPKPELIHATLSLPPGSSAGTWGHTLAIAPDGQSVCFTMTDSVTKAAHLWLRSFDDPKLRRIEGTEWGYFPFWSPDGRQIGFAAGRNTLKTVPVAGGPPTVVTEEISAPRGSTWMRDNTILLTTSMFTAVERVPAAGGKLEPVTQLERDQGDQTHRWPVALPDGEHFLFYARASENLGGDHDAICVGSLKDGSFKRLLKARSQGIYSAGHLLFVRGNTLLAQPFDLDKLELAGDPFPVVQDLSYTARFSMGDFSATADGRLVYTSGAIVSSTSLVLLDDAGVFRDTIGEPAEYVSASLSPDNSRAVIAIYDLEKQNFDLWIHDVQRDVRSRLTFGPEYDNNPIWSPDGRFVAYTTGRKLVGDTIQSIAVMEVDGDGEARSLLFDTTASNIYPVCWSPSGEYIICNRDRTGNNDIVMLSPTNPSQWIELRNAEFDEGFASVSPDGRWLAYQSNETGQAEVYITTFPTPGRKWQVSKDRGQFPQWRDGGGQLTFQTAAAIAVVNVDATGASLKFSEPRELFRVRPGLSFSNANANGTLFMFREALNSGSLEIHFVTDWLAAAKKR